MHYNLVFYPDWANIHVDKELTKKVLEKYHGIICRCDADKNRGYLETQILCCEGVLELHIDRYTFFIQKGQAFEWDEIIEPILRSIAMAIDPVNGLEQRRPHMEKVLPTPNSNTYETRIKLLPNIPNPYHPLRKENPPKAKE